MEGQTVHVTLLEPTRQTTLTQQEEEPLCSIKVTGVSKIGSKDTIEFYFENQKRSGGGFIKLFDVHKEEDYAYVTFEAEDGKSFSYQCALCCNFDCHSVLRFWDTINFAVNFLKFK